MSIRLAFWLAVVFAVGALSHSWRHDHRCADCHERLARSEADFRRLSNVIALSRYARSRA